ncbi:hypothetical protein [Carboxylicivirga taeanensis]|uniref:hypothetical protein n=1 Tax=Carboxylicivirga taeanensis TaxID=1416875 RepID=UPI003F6DDC90
MTKMEAQYFKLIGVTLLMTAACVSDSGTKKPLFFNDGDVREIILEQFHILSSSHWSQVLDWENAVKEIDELSTANRVPSFQRVFYVLKTSQSLPDLQETEYGLPQHISAKLLSFQSLVNFHNTQTLVLVNPNKYSLAVRAGPVA